MKFPPAFINETKNINVIVETPKGSSNKYAYDEETDLFKLKKILPEGLIFPLHFGFIPGTKGQDGDPLDVLIFMDAESYPGCLVECKVLGVIEAKESDEKGIVRNDRIVAAVNESHRYKKLDSLKNLDKDKLNEIVEFFVSYNKLQDKKFKPMRNRGARTAIRLIEENKLP